MYGWRLCNPSGQPVLVFDHPLSEKRLGFFMYKLSFLCFGVLHIASYSVTGHHWEKPDLLSFATSQQVLIHMEKIPLSLFSPRLRSSSSFSLSPHERCSKPWTIILACHWTSSSTLLSVLYWEAQNWTRHSSTWSGSSVLRRGKRSKTPTNPDQTKPNQTKQANRKRTLLICFYL